MLPPDDTGGAALSPRDRRIARGFDRISPFYDALAWTLSARGIPRSQVRFLDRVTDRTRALIVGGGSGRFLVSLIEAGFRGTVVHLDLSAGMLHRASRRLTARYPQMRNRVEFRQGGTDRLSATERFDLICTHYFLDLFEPEEMRAVHRRLDRALLGGGSWLCADFTEPHGAIAGRALRAGLVRSLYAAFGALCSVRARRLPPIRGAFGDLGYEEACFSKSRAGLLGTGLYRKPRAGTAGSS